MSEFPHPTGRRRGVAGSAAAAGWPATAARRPGYRRWRSWPRITPPSRASSKNRPKVGTRSKVSPMSERGTRPQAPLGVEPAEEFIASRPFGLSEEDLNRYLDQARQQLRENSSGITRGAVRGATLLGEVVTGLILTLFLTFVFVKDSARCATRSSCGWCVARAAPGSTCAADLPATSCPGRNLRPTTGSDPFLGNEERPKAPSDGTRPPWLQRGPSPTHRTKGDRNARLEAESTPDHHAARLGLPRVTAPAGDPASHAPMGIRRSSRCRHHPQAARHKRAADVM